MLHRRFLPLGFEDGKTPFRQYQIGHGRLNGNKSRGEKMPASEEVRKRLLEKMRRELGPNILEFLNDDEVIEIMLNDDGRVWVIKFGASDSIETGVIMPDEQSLAFLGTVASYYGKTIFQSSTILAEVLPLDGSRINGVIPPTTERPSFNIRKRAKRIFTLDEYVAKGRMTENDKKIICDGVGERQNFLIAGATGSGKTTLTNAVLQAINEINPKHRIVSMEDTAELQIPQRNKVRMYTDDNTSMQKLLFSAMRQSPDRITSVRCGLELPWTCLKAGIRDTRAASPRCTRITPLRLCRVSKC
jgi:type IV secretion system protein VirB11